MSKANIILDFEGLSFEEVEHIRAIINIMFESDCFTVRNGKVILNFDYEGTLQEVAVDHKRWRRKKS